MGEDIEFDTDDTKAAMSYLRQEGIPSDTIGQGLSHVEPFEIRGGLGRKQRRCFMERRRQRL